MNMMVSPYKKQKTHHVQSWTFRHQAFEGYATVIYKLVPSDQGFSLVQLFLKTKVLVPEIVPLLRQKQLKSPGNCGKSSRNRGFRENISKLSF